MVSGSAIATLVLFILSIIFVIRPISIPLRPIFKNSNTRIPINLTTAPILAIAILWAAQCLGPSVIRTGIAGSNGIKPYNILILFFSLAYMTITLDITGLLEAAAFWVSNKGGANGWKLYFYFYILVTLLSMVLGNDPVILSGTAFLVYYTKAVSINPLAWLIAEFAAANTASMVLFVGNPTNVVICEGFKVNNVAFSAYTIFPFLACNIACFGALIFQFRAPQYVPKKLGETRRLDPKSVLLDPISAWVGSILLGSCLAIILVVSFFGVDVWMISLPFAAAKFVWDLSWDAWRVKHDMVPGRGDKGKEGNPESWMERELSRTFSSADEMPMSFSTLGGGAGPRRPGIPPPPHRENSQLTEEQRSVDPLSFSQRTDATAVAYPAIPPNLSQKVYAKLLHHFPTFAVALPRLPFALIPFAFSQFILIEALAHQGWIDIFAHWLLRATSGGKMYPTVWLVGVLGVILCNISGTNIGATILLTNIVRSAASSSTTFPSDSLRGAAIALAVASNIGAVGVTFSASLAGLLWQGILKQKGLIVKQKTFARWNLLLVAVMTAVGLGVVSAEMRVLYPHAH